MKRQSNYDKRDDKRGTKEKRNGRGKTNMGNRRPQNPKTNRSEGAVIPESEVEKRDLNNDPNWYFTNKEIANQASQLSFQSYLGVPNTFESYTVPTIMTIGLNPSPGNTYNGAPYQALAKSGFNMSITKLFNKLSMSSGRNMAYAPQDVGMMMLMMGELMSMVSYMRRLFGIPKYWNQRNRMAPKAIIKAMGIDPDDFFQNLSDYRMRANTLILAMNQIPLLTNSGYLRKCASLYDNIYSDCDTGMAQLYIFVPNTTWLMDEASDQRGTVLVTTDVTQPLGTDPNTVQVRTFANFLQNIMEPMVNSMLTSSTLNLVYADILNLNKYENLYLASFDPIAEDYAVVPQYDELVLKQIHNSFCLGVPPTVTEAATYTSGNNVVCDPSNNSIKYSPLFEIGAQFSNDGFEVVIDTDNSDPDIVERIEITRYTAAYSNSQVTIGGVTYNIWASGPDHYVTWYIVYTDAIDSSHSRRLRSVYNSSNWDEYNLTVLSTFDWFPIQYRINNATPALKDRVFADLGACTSVRSPYLRRLNGIIYMDLFEYRDKTSGQ